MTRFLRQASCFFAILTLQAGITVPSTLAQNVTFGSGANRFTMNFTTIGNPGNANDTTGAPNPAGRVNYTYQMGTYEVSEDMITKYNANYGTANGQVITQTSRGANRPAGEVSLNESLRFVNWLNTRIGGFAAYKFTTSGVNDNFALWTPADTLDYDPNANGGAGGYWDYPTASNAFRRL